MDYHNKDYNIYNTSDTTESNTVNIIFLSMISICFFCTYKNYIHNYLKQSCIKIFKKFNPKKFKETIYTNTETELCCSICLENFKYKDKVSVLPCNHIYHRSCISLWYNKDNSCPLCRINI